MDKQEGDCLCDSHRAYMVRYLEFELRRQEQVSDRFLRAKRALNSAPESVQLSDRKTRPSRP